MILLQIAVLFPGESIFSTSEQHSKDTVWALYMRSLLLWNGCVYMRNDASMADTDKAQYAIDVWLEIDKIEVALNQHTCNIERTFMFVSRDYLFMLVSDDCGDKSQDVLIMALDLDYIYITSSSGSSRTSNSESYYTRA